MMRHKTAFPLMVLLGLSACTDSSPVANEGQLDQASFELLAEAALEVNDQQGTPLPSLNNLLRRTYKAIREQDGHAQGLRLLKAGYTLRGIIVVLGPEVVEEAQAGVDQALARLDERLAGKTLPKGMQRALDKAKALAGRSHEASAAGNHAGALGAALASADLIRSFSQRYRARKAIERANRWDQGALAAVGTTPTEAETAALEQALELRNTAVEFYRERNYREAWKAAQESMALSQEVYKGRVGG